MDMKPYKFPDEQDDQEDKIELELEGDEKVEIEVVDDTPPEDRGRKPLDKEVEEPTEDELNEYSSKVQKRLKELTHARHDERRRGPGQLGIQRRCREQVGTNHDGVAALGQVDLHALRSSDGVGMCHGSESAKKGQN